MIDEKAADLGRLIGQTEEYKALRRAHERVKEQQGLQDQMGRLHAVAEQLDRATSEGGEPPEALMQEYDGLLGTIQADPRYQAVIAAQSNFDKLMVRVNEQIMDGIRRGAASPIITLS
jgi:cell fate (sporulation/competence/biofilm development) regulator YlbF (YheA/YmcA/DUF963 family)